MLVDAGCFRLVHVFLLCKPPLIRDINTGKANEGGRMPGADMDQM
jgi:hypothetical protein